MAYRIGIDIGSTTVKTAILDESGELVFKRYERHFSRVREKAAEQLAEARAVIGGAEIYAAITGSAGLGVSKATGIPFVQEVFATAAAVDANVPDADAVIELGGEDAKIIFFGNSLEERMNGSCAGGTGAFIDQMATLLNVTVEELDRLSAGCEKIYPIASRCGVFAKSDIQPILNQGGRKEDLAASIYQAVVDQTVSGLTQGRELKGKIVFLGGPLTFQKGLRLRFTETLGLDAEHAVFPENAENYAAIGAALCSDGYEKTDCESIITKLRESVNVVTTTASLPPLFESEEEYAEFRARHARATPVMRDIAAYEGGAYLGIDAGSTTTKLVLISPEGEILYSYYGSNLGAPVALVKGELEKLYAACGDRIKIFGAAVTGYGEELIKNAFRLDKSLVETVAHYRAARHFDPDVDFIIDIGGQDMKCFKIRNGAVDSIMLNEACSSGCGSFVESFARALGYEIKDFAELGIMDKSPADLGSRCTVFMNSSVKQAQKEGKSVADISAGLSVSVVKNAIYKVIRAASADDLGKNIVVQGGTFLNDAVLRGFEKELGRNVTRPVIAGLMGAYGAALYAADSGMRESTILSADELKTFTHTAKPTTCHGCTNRCSLTINTFDGGRRYISGNRCSKPLGGEKSELPNLYRAKREMLAKLCGKGSGTGERGRIGIPMGLNMFENLPFWFELFTALNFEVVLSPVSSRELFKLGQSTIPSDTVCYPAKLMHGHVLSLINDRVETIFYPCMSYNFDEGKGDNHYNCPVVAYYPELLGANVTELRNVRYIDIYVGLHRPKDFSKRFSAYMEETMGVPTAETKAAVRRAYAAYGVYKDRVRALAAEYIDYARANGKRIAVVAGRPYHADPEINHGIDELISSLDMVVVSEDGVNGLVEKAPRRVLNQWTYQARMYDAARWAASQKDAELIQLISFGCGTDAITSDEVRDIMESAGRLYTPIKIDDISNLGAVRIRLRSMLAACESREGRRG